MINHMVEQNSQQLDNIFRALADPTRREMLRSLTEGEQRVSDLAEPFAMSLAGASKHIKVLESAGLVRRSVRGRTHWCELDASHLAEVHEWLSYYKRFWNRSLEALEALLRSEDEAGASTDSKEDS
ncbi:winged helix-turn-helix transcriptional regulator [Kineobactrum salinum]|uniref:Winged helix-turn-helix transcriptional regulator n=2 Tax=Kineobactrum salinum TaxID=2708301 RepID=A0A6C0UC63_9GAMM|nr:winged helix-turn-helix transcriptional regulator [Kineobactrum salinum]